MTDGNSGNDKALLAAALLAETGQAIGPAPSDHELAQWAAQALEEPRLGEVESHIAHSPAAFERAMAIVNRAAPTEATANRWRAPLALAATAVIAVAGLATFLRSPPSTTTPGEPATRVVRGGDGAGAALDWRGAAFRGGYAGAPRSEILSPDNLRIEQCLDGDDCRGLAGVLYRYGAVLAELDGGCASGTAAPAEARGELAEVERAIAGSFELGPWLEPLRRLRAAMDSGSDATCEEVATLKQRHLQQGD